MRYTDYKSDCILYWRSILHYFAWLYDNDRELEDESIIDIYISLTGHLIQCGIAASDYVDILHCASTLEYVDDIERLLDAAECEGELEGLVRDMIRCLFVEEDMDRFIEMKEEFTEKQSTYMGADRIAAISIWSYFEMYTEEE